jgi:hypothetical protein
MYIVLWYVKWDNKLYKPFPLTCNDQNFDTTWGSFGCNYFWIGP